MPYPHLRVERISRRHDERALTYLAVRQSRPFPLTAEAVALSRLNVLVRFAAHWLPAGAAWMLVLAGLLFGISLARSLAHPFGKTFHRPVADQNIVFQRRTQHQSFQGFTATKGDINLSVRKSSSSTKEK